MASVMVDDRKHFKDSLESKNPLVKKFRCHARYFTRFPVLFDRIGSITAVSFTDATIAYSMAVLAGSDTMFTIDSYKGKKGVLSFEKKCSSEESKNNLCLVVNKPSFHKAITFVLHNFW